ncbi:hypothetical protein C8R43DRAFT_1079123 [Mycena crocata]|nr:hypothetical protein C8R43DRAFT_1079123 [Mycena crocata]
MRSKKLSTPATMPPESASKRNPSPPRPMRMEVVIICLPANLKRKWAPDPAKSSDITSKDSVPPPKKRSRKMVVEHRKAAGSANDDETVSARPHNRKKKTGGAVASSSKEKPRSHGKHKEKKARRHSSPLDSGDEVEAEHIIESRLRTRNKLSAKERALERLKCARAKQPPPKTPPESSDSSEDESDSEHDSLFDGSDSDRSSDFIVEDDGGTVVLPKEFSMDAHEGIYHQFRKIFQFMVHVAIRPPLERQEFMQTQLKEQDYFSIPFHAAQRKISSIRGSVASSRWQPAFIALLEKYSVFETKDLPSTSTVECDLCGRKGRRDCKKGMLSGVPYHRMGYEDTQDDSSDDSSDDDNASMKKPEKTTFRLGRFCVERLSLFHQLSHWEYDLFKCILREVDQLHEAALGKGHILNDRDVYVSINKFGKKPPPKDLHDADAIDAWLVDRNVADIEWAKLKLMMDQALNIETAVKRGRTD